MATIATEAQEIETAVSFDLPDPTTVANRTHEITNTGGAAATIGSVGATPFTTAAGANVATLSVGPGQSVQVQSNGTRWAVKTDVGAGRRLFAGSGVTDAAGNVTFTFTPPFTVAPNPIAQIGPSADTALVEARLTALSASSATFNVRRSPSVVILGISVLQVPQNAPGVTVHCLASEPGQGV